MPPLHPLIKGLIEVLPPNGKPWTLEEAAEWLQTAASNLRYAYKLQGRIKVEIEAHPQIRNSSGATPATD